MGDANAEWELGRAMGKPRFGWRETMGEQGLIPEGGGDRMRHMADRRAAVEACVEAMPEQFRELVVRHRRCIELCGRAGGSGLAILEGFVYGLRDAIEAMRAEGGNG